MCLAAIKDLGYDLQRIYRMYYTNDASFGAQCENFKEDRLTVSAA